MSQSKATDKAHSTVSDETSDEGGSEYPEPKVKTAGGRIERGSAMQRHFARKLESKHGLHIMMFSAESMYVYLYDDDNPAIVADVLELAEEYRYDLHEMNRMESTNSLGIDLRRVD